MPNPTIADIMVVLAVLIGATWGIWDYLRDFMCYMKHDTNNRANPDS